MQSLALARVLMAAFGLAGALLPLGGWCPAARAGAFNEPAGQGLVILEGLYDSGSHSYDKHGHLIRTGRYEKKEGWAYLQYGLTDWLQLIVKPDVVSTSLGGTGGAHYTGLGTSEAGAQVQLPSYGPLVFALQGTFHLPATSRADNLAMIGNTSRDTDGRGLVGASFEVGPYPAFVDAEAGYRIRGARSPDEVHVDLTFGVRPWSKILLMAQSFTTVPTQPGAALYPRSTYSNLEGSAVYALDDHWSLHLGLFGTVFGRDALRERGLQSGVWYRF